MAVVILAKRSLQLGVSVGYDEFGEEKIVNRTFSSINTEALPENLLEGALALSDLVEHEGVFRINVIETQRLEA